MKLKFVLSAILLASLVLPTSFISYIAYTQKVATNEQNQATVRRLTLNRSKERVESYLNTILEYVRADSNIPQFANFLTAYGTEQEAQLAEINAILRNVIVKDTLNVTSVALINTAGKNIQDIRIGQQSRDESSFAYFKRQSMSPAPVMHYSGANNKDPESIYFSSPIRSSDGKVVGYLRLMLETSAIQQLVNSIAKHLTYSQWLTISANETPIADSRQRQKRLEERDNVYKSYAKIKPFEWQIALMQTAQEHNRDLANYRQFLLLQIAILLIVSIFVSLVVARLMSRPVERVKKLAIEIAHRDLDKRIRGGKIDEFNELAAAINSMADNLVEGYRNLEREHHELEQIQQQVTELNEKLEKRVLERTQQLSAQNQALESAMQQIVQSEKLASLGSLVSGVSHELNTPIGVALTAGSFALEVHNKIANELKQKSLSVDSLSKHLQQLEEAIGLVTNNCHKASELVINFKQISGDHTSNKRRVFNLAQTLEVVVNTLNTKLLSSNTVSFYGLENVEIDSFPGAFEQVFINLINNSLVHGFDDSVQGKINISMQQSDANFIVINYTDDGKGIDIAHRDKIFDPFFTTRLGEGSSGLGLYIVFNLVTGVLGGEIKLCQSQGKSGVSFDIKLPTVAPITKIE
ncbi:ATP-binding protein [Pseudoalteromonas sp. XMcav1-K]|uniref:sensor histidine kinase n=1 Tax=Pseudoalteromonas sp. XMcav1-K TaxID=3374372 RepID=UPI003756AEC4